MLDLKVHKYTDREGRHWSTEEMRDYMDNKISDNEMRNRAMRKRHQDNKDLVMRNNHYEY